MVTIEPEKGVIMDIEYLLLLQNFREATGNVLSPFLSLVSKIAVSGLPVLLVLFIYWAFDRAAGKRLIGGVALGFFVNGLLKLIFCVYRPWIRDVRVEPYGDSKVAATGYSFPSGHSTWATSACGGMAIWLRNNGRRIVAALLWVYVALVLFSRNYLGVHTPQDVVVGFGATVLCMWAVNKMEAWTDADPRRDLYVMIAGLALCAAAAAFYLLKPYPMDYGADGSLIVDPVAMLPDSFLGVGLLAGYCVGRYYERRGFDFDHKMPGRSRIVCAAVALVVLIPWMLVVTDLLIAALGKGLAYFVGYFVAVIYAMAIVPPAMGLVARSLETRPSAK